MCLSQLTAMISILSQISPAELDEYLLKHPFVAEACVFGIEDTDGGDTIPRAVVVLKEGCKADVNEIRTFVDGISNAMLS